MDIVTMSLIDVLIPPANPWLKQLARSSVKLPPWVRVVRFDLDDDDDFDHPQAALEAVDLPRPAASDSQEQRE